MASSAITIEQLTQSIQSMAQTIEKMSQEVNAKFQETAREREKMSQETDLKLKEVAERQKEVAERQKKTDEQMKKTDEQMKKTDKMLGNLGNKLGELTEALFSGGALIRFQELGFEFSKCSRRVDFSSKKLGIYGEIDILLESKQNVLIVEVKTTLEIHDIKKQIFRADKYKLCANDEGDHRTIMSAVAGGMISEEVENFALSEGIYVIRQTGSSIEILEPKEKREW